MYQAEESHWWYRGMDAITRALLKRYLPTHTPLSILDAGCGTGKNMAGALSSIGTVTGMDISADGLRLCQQRHLTRIALADIPAMPFPTNHFDVVTCFDVLYSRHVVNDVDAVREIHRVLKPGGMVFIRVAAYEWLRGQHDLAVHTGRRYTRKSLMTIIEPAGFSVLKLTYANSFLFPLVVIKRLSEKLIHSPGTVSDTNIEPGFLNEILRRILSAETPFILRTGLPFGSSVFCVGSKE